MKISTRVRYGVRALMDIAENGSERPVSLKDVARRQGISEQYLEQLVLLLKGAGMLRSVRGSRGGFFLNRSASEIRINEIVKALGARIAFIDCLENQALCQRADCCAVRDLWQEANDAFWSVLSSVTLHDLMQQQQDKVERSRAPYYSVKRLAVDCTDLR
ncbi:MAG: Rrf2 family transcriptional regulator [Bacillota bacterium]